MQARGIEAFANRGSRIKKTIGGKMKKSTELYFLSNFKDYLYPEGDVYRLDELLDCARLFLQLLESEIEKNKDKNIF